MARKPKRNQNSKSSLHIEQARRVEVSRLMACGFETNHIAKKLGVHPNTIKADKKIISLQWWSTRDLNYETWLTNEVGRIETVRNSALECFYEHKNRHGEQFLTGYLMAWAKLTDQLHELLHLRDPQARHMVGGSDEDLTIVEVEISTHEQAESVLGRRQITYDEMTKLEEGTPDE